MGKAKAAVRSGVLTLRVWASSWRLPAVRAGSEHTDIGHNYRMSNLLAGLGRAQLQRLPAMIERRREWRRRYRELLANYDGVSLFGGPDGLDDADSHDNFWLSSVVVDEQRAGWTATGLRERLSSLNIEARPLWKPMHLQPVFRDATSYTNGKSEWFFRHGISLPSGSALAEEQFATVCDAIAGYVEEEAAA